MSFDVAQTSAMPAEVVGREEALTAIERFLRDARERCVALVVEGEPGIGKSVVWREAVHRGGERGFSIVSAQPTQAEAELGYAALTDLVGAVEDEVVSGLPAPQREALDAALLRRLPESGRIDPRAVAVALGTVLARMAEQSPIILALDDVQWLDRPSAAALSFALRRVAPSSPIGVLSAVRLDPAGAAAVLDLERSTAGRFERLRLGPLNLGSLYHVVRAELRTDFPRPVLKRIEQASGGNPLFAIEIGRVLAERGTPPVGEPLPVPANVETLLRRRVRRLPARTREVLLAAALLADPRLATIEAALGSPAETDLEPAERTAIARCREEIVVFAHPLYASAVVAAVTDGERRLMHNRLAAAASALEERARHLALGTADADETVAAVADAAAQEASQQGAPTVAAELVELALRVTPAGSSDKPARQFKLAEHLYAAGEPERARAALEALAAWDSLPLGLRQDVLELATVLCSYIQPPQEVVVFLEGLFGTPLPDEATAAAHLAFSYAEQQSDARKGLQHAETALALLDANEGAEHPALAGDALIVYARAQVVTGHGLESDLLRRAAELEPRLQPERARMQPLSVPLAFLFKWLDDIDTSRRLLSEQLARTAVTGYDMSRAIALMHLGETECLAGDLQRARECVLAAREIAEMLEAERLDALIALTLARVEAQAGDAEQVRRLSTTLGPLIHDAGGQIHLDGCLGLIELTARNDASAAAHLGKAVSRFEEAGFGEPGQFRIHADAAEAAVGAGEVERAEELAAFLERHGRASRRRWSLATAARTRALVAAARGQLDDALAATGEALHQLEGLPMAVELGRTILVQGVTQRRLRRRGRAKESFERALEIFEAAGAQGWAERARDELDRTGLRRGSGNALTASERRVAQLTAGGLTRRQVAATLFISPKTVDATLGRAYRKLGVRSRAELGARMAEPQASN